MITDFLLKSIFGYKDDIIIPLGTEMQKGTLTTTVYIKNLWKSESMFRKTISLLSLKYKPKDEKVLLAAQEILMSDIVGSESDYGDKLLDLLGWHNSRKWKLESLTESDIEKADSLDAFSLLVFNRIKNKESFRLNLDLYKRAPQICSLIFPMVVKVPVISFQYFLNIHKDFTFNSIRESEHPQANHLISYLYEILYLQQKIAYSLYDFTNQIIYAERNKKENLVIRAELNALMAADLIFSYLKASIEKIIVFVGLIYNLQNLDSKKPHKSKIRALLEGVPETAQKQFYFEFLMEFVKSENLEELNNYRSGILHKKGISDLQPHNYYGERTNTLPLLKIFEAIHEQHTKNTAILISSLALLTDDLVTRKPPKMTKEEVPVDLIIKYYENK